VRKQNGIVYLITFIMGILGQVVLRFVSIWVFWNLVVTKLFKVPSLNILNIILILFAWFLVSIKLNINFKKN